ncbi:phage portal protein [Nocardia sp. IFM 10818]
MQRLEAPVARYAALDRYYRGEQPLAFLSPEAKVALGNRFGRYAVNIPRLAVNSLAERLRVTGFENVDIWDDWLRNNLDQTSGVVHREALRLGNSHVIVWADRYGRPVASPESATQVAVLTDPGSRQVFAGVKRWQTNTTTEAFLYKPDEIVRLRANQTGATTVGYDVIARIPNPLGRVPVVPFINGDALLNFGDNPPNSNPVTTYGLSEIDDLACLVDALNKVGVDMLTTSEFNGRPRRYATGIELTEDAEGNEVSPIGENDRMMISENENSKFGQLSGATLDGYEGAARLLLGHITAISTLPPHYLGIFSENPTSADALRASEASLTARAENKQGMFGQAWEDVARLMVAVRDQTDPDRVNPRVKWADPSTRSVSQEADAIVKLYAAGLLPRETALSRLGYTDAEILDMRAAAIVADTNQIGDAA